MKVALVYDRVNKWGGAERVLLALHSIFPKAPLYTAVYNKSTSQWADVFTVHPSFLQKVPYARSHHEAFAPLMPVVFESFSFDKYDLVISVTSEAAKGIITHPTTRHVCICLTPTRYLWSGYNEYFKNPFFRFFSRPLVGYLRKWDTIAAHRPETMIAISETVQRRIQKFYKRESIVIYPPAGIPNGKIKNSQLSTLSRHTLASTLEVNSPFFLVVSRLSKMTAYKRVDIAIKAANILKINLVIVGTGRDAEHYKNMAGDTVTFVGDITDDELIRCYLKCQALIFPGNEDFGLVMAEAQIYGKPVIAYRGGGATEIIREGITGEFFDRQSIRSLIDVLKSFDNTRYNEKDCIANGRRFSMNQFEKKLRKVIDQ